MNTTNKARSMTVLINADNVGPSLAEEIFDVGLRCNTVWYYKNEISTLVPNDGVMQTSVLADRASAPNFRL